MNIFIAIVVAVVIGLGGYFWYSDSSNNNVNVTPQVAEQTPSPADEPTPATTPQPGVSVDLDANVTVKTESVGIVSYQYSPKVITVKVGTKVTWTNRDTVAHTITATGANGGPDSTLFGQNGSYSFTFDKEGTYDYYCKPHPYMKGTVIVTN